MFQILNNYLRLFFLLVAICNHTEIFSKDSSGSDSLFTKLYNESGSLVSEGTLINNRPNGYWRNYYDNGKLKSEGNRVNYDLDGVWKFYTSDGLIINSISYSKGKKNGNKITFDPVSGDTLMIESFVNDKKEGNSLFFTNSKLIKVIPFVEGKENGVGKEFDSNGTLISLIYYKSGFISRQEKINRRDFLGRKQGIYKTFFSNTLKENIIAYYTDDKLNGYYKEFNERGDIVKNEKWVDGVLQKNTKETRKLDIRKDYYDSGSLKSVSTYYNGKLEGIMRVYNDSGLIIGSKQFANGILINEGILDERGLQQGIWKEYDSDGVLRAIGSYDNGKKTGIWKYFFSSGVIEQVGSYFKGKPDGEWNWFFANGSLLRKENFIKGLPDGNYYEYDSLGQLIVSGSFQDGAANGKWFIIDNDCKSEGLLKDGLKNGVWTSVFLSNGKIASKGSFIEGLENGKFTYYYDNGNINEEGIFNYGQRSDRWKHFDKLGNLVSYLEYIDSKDYKINGMKIPFYDTSISEESEQQLKILDSK